MTHTIFQKFMVAMIQVLIAPLWLLDYSAGLLSKNKLDKLMAGLGLAGLLVFMLFLVPHRYGIKSVSDKYSKVSLLHTGIVSEIYGTTLTSQSQPIDPNVMGSSQKVAKNPVLVNKIAFPFITAKAHLVIDNKTGKVFSQHNANMAFAPASTTKLMTSLVAMDLYKEKDVVMATERCAAIDSTKLWLPVDTEYYVKDLIFGLLINSAGDAGCILANSKVDQDDFVGFMNKKAAELGLKNTNFTNPVGLDGANGSNYSTVWDLYTLSNKIMENNVLRNIVKIKNHTFTDISGDVTVNLENTNKLLWDVPETIGIKTGRTSGAGEVLIYRYDDGEKDITIIVMSSEDRFSDTQELLKWTLSSYKWM